MAELIQTNGKVRIEGIVVGFDPSEERTYKAGESKTGKDYKSLNVVLKTNDNNVIYDIGLYGQVKDKVKLYGKVNGEKQNIEADWSKRNERPAGFTCFGFGTVRTGFEKDDSGKVKMKNYFNYDGAEFLSNAIENGQSVWVDGAFNVENYQSNGEPRTRVKYTVEGIGLAKNQIDFTQENFKEVASFEQEFVILGTEIDKQAMKLYVQARIINFDKTWKDLGFVVDANKYPTLATNIQKKCKFGDLLNVQGVIRSGTETVEVKEEALDWGGEIPQGQGKVNRARINELQITNVLKHTAKVYREEDFVVQESNPFGNDTSEPFENAEDDLPWN
jgi:hypothetical protein